jgi:hypothetical protein
MEELLETVSSLRIVKRLYGEDNWTSQRVVSDGW